MPADHRHGSGTLMLRQVFISDIRACQNKEQEQRRVEKELAKIRARFGEDKALSGETPQEQLRATPTRNRNALMQAFMFWAQAMIGASIFGSSFTSICWALTLTSAINRPVT